MMAAKEILEAMSFGASVAEHDNDLRGYFVETSTFKDFIHGRGDIVAGDKGTGKSSIYRILRENFREYPELDDIHLVDSFNLHGNPIFQRLNQVSDLTEGELQTVWKSYIFSLVGNWLLGVLPDHYNTDVQKLANTLEHLGLRSADSSPETVFSKIVGAISSLRSAETTFSITETGMPIVVPKVTFGSERKVGDEIYNDDYLLVLSRAVKATGYRLWILFDRLDEAFAGRPAIEVPALRALLRTYLDLVGLDGIEIKIFLRKDLYRRITAGGFVNLSHINSRTIEIVWDDEDLWNMVERRLLGSETFLKFYGDDDVPSNFLSVLLPPQIDFGKKKSTALNWILSRIRHGNDVKPPRSIIDLFNDARAAQLRKEGRESRIIDYSVGPLIEAVSVKKAFEQLSAKRVEDTLLAEAGEFADYIRRFRDGKATHNRETLSKLVNNDENFEYILKGLIDTGFLGQEGDTYKVPMLYRSGLSITQGRAFDG